MAADENKPEPRGASGIAERLRNALFGRRKQAGKDSAAGEHAVRGYSYLLEFRCRGQVVGRFSRAAYANSERRVTGGAQRREVQV